MPLRFVWGVQKGGTTSLFSMLRKHRACGTTTRWKGQPILYQHLAKESHYLEISHKNLSRAAYMATYPAGLCLSLCFVEGTPDYLHAPMAAAQLRAVMTSTEAVLCLHARIPSSAWNIRRMAWGSRMRTRRGMATTPARRPARALSFCCP